LLCADASVRQGAFGEVIPECDFAIIDEAHQLEDVVTHYFGVVVSAHRLDEFCRDAAQALGQFEATAAKAAVWASEGITAVQLAMRHLLDAARVEATQGRTIITAESAERLFTAGEPLADALLALASRLSPPGDTPCAPRICAPIFR
jgi:Rad3-related DNA helicase